MGHIPTLELGVRLPLAEIKGKVSRNEPKLPREPSDASSVSSDTY